MLGRFRVNSVFTVILISPLPKVKEKTAKGMSKVGKVGGG